MPPEQAEQSIPYAWFVGIAWGSQQHQVCVLDRDRRLRGQRAVDHDGTSLAQLVAWRWALLHLAPTPAHALLLSEEQVQRVLKVYRIRRIKAPAVLVC